MRHKIGRRYHRRMQPLMRRPRHSIVGTARHVVILASLAALTHTAKGDDVVSFDAALAPANLVLVRTTGAGGATLDEVTPGGAVVQSVFVPACNASAGPLQSYAALSADGLVGMVPCFPYDPTDGNSTGAVSRVVTRVFPNGTVTSTALLPVGAPPTTSYPRSFPSTNGSAIYDTNSFGLYYVPSATHVVDVVDVSRMYFGAAVVTFAGARVDGVGRRASGASSVSESL